MRHVVDCETGEAEVVELSDADRANLDNVAAEQAAAAEKAQAERQARRDRARNATSVAELREVVADLL